MSIATKHGDKGRTALIGGARVSKADLRVEAYGTIDELGATLGFARSICDDAEVRELAKNIQRELFSVSGAVANPESSGRPTPYVTREMVEALTAHVHRIEAMEGILSDWSLPGEHAAAAAFDVARTVCRRAERAVVRLSETATHAQEAPAGTEEPATAATGTQNIPAETEEETTRAAEPATSARESTNAGEAGEPATSAGESTRAAEGAPAGAHEEVVAYLNRLSDLLWLFGRLLELRAGIDARLRDDTHTGPRWSRAW